MEIVKQRRRLREKVIEEAGRWARSLPFKATAVLIGSYARGDFNLWSDVDVIVISEFRGNPLQRLAQIDFPPGFEVIPLTPEEYRRLVEKGDHLAVEARRYGVILRDDYRIFED